MTHEQKFKRLLQVAVENGWKTDRYNNLQQLIVDGDCTTFKVSVLCCAVDNDEPYPHYQWFSINDLVGNWEYLEISFLQALCLSPVMQETLRLKYDTTIDSMIWIEVKDDWFKRPTSQRFKWLCDTFQPLFKQ